jgi:hypothetical protein
VSVFVPWPPTNQSSRIGAPLPNSEG